MENRNLTIAITSCGPTPDSNVDERFGRAYWLLLFDEQGDHLNAIDNGINRNAPNGAGREAVATLVDYDVSILLTGETGPKAFRLLREARIDLYHGVSGSCLDTLQAWREGKLKRARSANDAGSPYCLMADIPVRVSIFNKLRRT